DAGRSHLHHHQLRVVHRDQVPLPLRARHRAQRHDLRADHGLLRRIAPRGASRPPADRRGGQGMKNRADAIALLHEFTKGDALRKHARGVEEAMRAYARWYGVTDPGEIEKWGIVGMLHDFDYEQNQTEETHLHVGTKVMRERGWPEEIIEAVASH